MEELIPLLAVATLLIAFLSILLYANLPIQWTIGKVQQPGLPFLYEAKLVLIRDEEHIDMEETIDAKLLLCQKPTFVIVVRKPGCPLCRKHADQMSRIMPEVESHGMQIIAVVLDPIGVNDFKQYFRGNVFYDDERKFFGENPIRVPYWMGFLRFQTYGRLVPALYEGYRGTFKGNDHMQGGMYLIANGKLAWSHPEQNWGDLPDEGEIMNAISDWGVHRLNV